MATSRLKSSHSPAPRNRVFGKTEHSPHTNFKAPLLTNRLIPKEQYLKNSTITSRTQSQNPSSINDRNFYNGFYEQYNIKNTTFRGLIRPNESSSMRYRNTIVAKSVMDKKLQEAKVKLEK